MAAKSDLELKKLIARLLVIVPIAAKQEHDQQSADMQQHFEGADLTGPSPREQLQRTLSIDELLKTDFQEVDTPEVREVRAIGLAVAAFGGTDAISEIGWAPEEKGCTDYSYVWNAWDGMAGHWL